jgi:hypothetical protein
VDENYENLAFAGITLEMKNIGSNNLDVRVETIILGQEFIHIVNGEQQKAWTWDGAWQDVSENFSLYRSQWSQWSLDNSSQICLNGQAENTLTPIQRPAGTQAIPFVCCRRT